MRAFPVLPPASRVPAALLGGVSFLDSIPGTRAWKASSGLTLSSTDVAVWTDYINGATMTMSSGSRPTFYATGGPNNGPYIKKPSGKLLAIDSLPFTTSPISVYAVIRTPTIIADSPLIDMAFSGGASGPRYNSNGISGYWYTGQGASASATYYNWQRTTWMLLSLRMSDNDTFSAAVHDDPPVLIERNGGGTTANTFATPPGFTYADIEVAEIRVIPSYTSYSDHLKICDALIASHSLSRPAKQFIHFGDSHSGGLGYNGAALSNPYYKNAMLGAGALMCAANTPSTCGGLNDTGNAYDLADIYQSYNLSRYSGLKKVFQYGTNDCIKASAPYGFVDWPTWKATYKSYIQSFITNGTSASNICLITPPNCTNPSLGGNLSTVKSNILAIASELGATSIDWTQLCIDAGKDAYTIVGGDGLHCDDSMHALLTTPLVSFLNA